MTKIDQIEIRSLSSIEELEEVRKLESKIWGENDSIPTHQTVTAVKNGGLVLGAYYEGSMVGFQYSFPGFDGQSVYLCSHMLGIDQEYRNKGIGKLLKVAQREEAFKYGYNLITWTYDPLESANGYLNIQKLGGICGKYLENCYGEMEDLLNSGIPSDRFFVEWHIGNKNDNESSLQIDQIDLNDAIQQSFIKWSVDEEGLPAPIQSESFQDGEFIFVAIPKDFRSIRESNSRLANEWRYTTRNVFKELFQHGWKVRGFHKNSQEDIPVQFYVLTK